MPEQEPTDYVVPVVSEQVQAGAVPVETGRVRVSKRVESHDETIEQEVRQGRVEVKRVAVNQLVDGPMQPRQEGNTLIVPIVSEVLKIEKQWVLTEEIHLIQTEQSRRVSEQVAVAREIAQVQRLDEEGRVISEIAAAVPVSRQPAVAQTTTSAAEPEDQAAASEATRRPPARRVLAGDSESQEATRKVLTGKTASIVKKS